jgi:GcrA cell cycle regulator
MSLTYLENRHNIHDTPWTAGLVERLKVLWAEGLSATQVANELKGDITRCAVIGKVHRLGLPARKARQQPDRPYIPTRRAVPKPPAPPPRPKPPPPPPPGAPKMRRLQLVKLQPHHCRWPCGDVGTPEFFFCAADAHGEIYCPFHKRMARVRRKDE